MTGVQFDQIALTMARKAKVAIDAAMPDSLRIAAPVTSARAAATSPPAMAAGSTGQCACASQSGRPGSKSPFIAGRNVSQAEV